MFSEHLRGPAVGTMKQAARQTRVTAGMVVTAAVISLTGSTPRYSATPPHTAQITLPLLL